VTNTARWPLLIDPQLQGITWIRQREAASGMVIVRMEQKDMLRKMEAAIEKGTPVLVENMGERIDAVLNPIIARQLIKKGSRQYVKVGEKELDKCDAEASGGEWRHLKAYKVPLGLGLGFDLAASGATSRPTSCRWRCVVVPRARRGVGLMEACRRARHREWCRATT
jgi:hypothetical protein